jgi:multifunctional 2-oxoglutarate metabolism enzyme
LRQDLGTVFENVFETVNSGFAQALYEDFLRDPASVPPEWRALFESGVKGEVPGGGVRAERAVRADGAEDAATTPVAPVAPVAPVLPVVPITGPALRLLRNMEASLEVPTATSFRDVDVGRLAAFRTTMNRALAARGKKLSFTHVIGWAIVRACERFPSMYHAVVDVDGAPHRLTPDAVNFGLAVDVERKDGSRGLMVPIIRNAGRLGFGEYHTEYERLVAGARDGKLLPDAYQGGTITLTNPGTIGTVGSVPRLMQGQGSIIATGAIRDVAGRQLMTITSTYDHRIIQGAESGMFLQVVDQLLQGEHRFFHEIAEELDVQWEPSAAPAVSAAPAAVAAGVGLDTLTHVAAAMQLVGTFRTHGYLAAQIDPLGVPPKGEPGLDPANLGLTPAIMARIPVGVLSTFVGGETLADAVPRLRETYCGTIAYEIEHIANHEERSWLRRVIESGEHFLPLSDDDKRELLRQLTKVDTLERFLHKAYLGHKRFGIEGLDTLVPMLRRAIDLSYEQGTRDIVMGMAHRGRLNVLCHILGLSYEVLLAEFEGGRAVEETLTPRGGTGDVKYHHGASGTFTTPRGDTLDITLMPNPSHLEAVNPVVEGYARAHQTDRAGADALHEPCCVLPILMHGDAAFAAQGVVAETLNLSKLAGYGTGGTLHVIMNNQVGFTTDPRDARSTDFASDLAKGFDIPIVHVNADDAEACVAAVNLAMMYRRKFAADVVINLVGYRRHGHNEGDEPRYTQPVMYQAIDRTPRSASATPAGSSSWAWCRRRRRRRWPTAPTRSCAHQEALRADLADGEWDGAEPDRVGGMFVAVTEPDTAVPEELLREVNAELHAVPDGFTINRKLVKQFRQRAAYAPDAAIEWAHAEALALGTLRTDGVPIRLTGQDTRRGTFSQRHLVLHDAGTGAEHVPLQHLPGACAARAVQLAALRVRRDGLRVRLRHRRPEDPGAVGGAVRRLRERRRDRDRPVHHRRHVEVGPDIPAHAAAAARLRGPGTRALERPGRTLSRAGRRGQHPCRELLDARAVLPPAAPPGAARRAPAARDLHAQEPAAAPARGVAVRGAQRGPVPAGAGRSDARGRPCRGVTAGALLGQDLLRRHHRRAPRRGAARGDRADRAALSVPRGRGGRPRPPVSQREGDRLAPGGTGEHGPAEVGHAAAGGAGARGRGGALGVAAGALEPRRGIPGGAQGRAAAPGDGGPGLTAAANGQGVCGTSPIGMDFSCWRSAGCSQSR